MSEDPIRKYSDATKEFNAICTIVRALGEITADVGRYLNNKPFRLKISNVGVEFPPFEEEYSLNANNWPSAKQIAEALVSLHEKAKLVENVYASLSPIDKTLVKSPEIER